MDVAEFAVWLGEIRGTDAAAAAPAWQTLALSEAAGRDDIEAGSPRDVDLAASGPATTPDQPPTVTPLPVARPLNRPGTDVVADLGQRRVDSIGCPHCNGRDVVHWSKASALPRYRCKGCQRTFNGLTKTPLAGLRMKDKWPAQAEALIDGVSIARAAKRCGVDYTTAFRWGIVESDETFILETFKGKRSGIPRKARKRGGKCRELHRAVYAVRRTMPNGLVFSPIGSATVRRTFPVAGRFTSGDSQYALLWRTALRQRG